MYKRNQLIKHSFKFILPAVLIIASFSFYPMIQALFLSFQTGRGVVTEFGGLANYQRLFQDPVFFQALMNTLIFLVVQVPIMTLLALLSATLLNDKSLKFKGFFRVCIFLPSVTSLVAYSILFRSLFSTNGLINEVLMNLSIINDPIAWLLHPFWARVVIILALTWRWTGYAMIFYLAAMQNIDESIYEAARIDGASAIKQFFKITIPMLKPIILFNIIMSTNGTIQLFDEVVNLTGGGPNNATLTIATYIYDLTFRFAPNFGYATTVSFSILILVVTLSFIQFKVANRKGL